LPILYGAQASGQAELSRERARLARAQSVKAERENELRSRVLLHAAEVEQHVTGAFKALAESLATLPDRLENQTGLDGASVGLLHAAIDAAREVLYKDLVTWIDQQPKPGADEPTPTA
jgi:phage terminase Nu1 subunit (DNA packaging protein)